MDFNILFQVENQSDIQPFLDLAERLGIRAIPETPEEIEKKAFKKRLAARKRFVKIVEENRKQMTEFPTEAEIAEALAEARFHVFGSTKELTHVASNY